MTATERLAAVDVPLADLHTHPRNPRTIRPERLEHLKRTLEAERGMLDARPLIALPDGTVVAGNQRLEAARQLGWETIPTVYADLSEEQQTRWMLLDNRPFGDDNEEAVATLLQELEQAGSDLDLTGYTRQDTDRMLRELTRPARDPDEAPPVPAEPKSVRGEVYELGPHRLMCGDATDPADVGALMAGQEASLLFTDPPYGVNYQGDEDPESLRRRNSRTDGLATVANDALGDEGTRALVVASLTAALPHLRAGSSFYICAPSGTSETAFRLALADASLELRQVIVWAKDMFAFGRQDYHWRHESILYGWVAGAAHRWNGGRDQDTVWEVPRPKRSELHPTMKPVELIDRALANSSDRGDIVLDPFAGSGSTLIAANGVGREARLMELAPAYCDVIRQRYADHTGQPQYAP